MSGVESLTSNSSERSRASTPASAGLDWQPWVFDLMPAMCMDFSLYVSFFAIQQLLKASKVGPDLLGTTFAAYSAGYIVFCPLISIYVGRFRSLSLLGGLVIGLFCLTGFRYSTELWHFQVLLGLMSLSTACFWPSFQNIIGEDCEPIELPRRLAFFNLGWTVGKASGLVAAGFLTASMGRDIFWIAFALSSLCTLLFFARFWRVGFFTRVQRSQDDEASPERDENEEPALNLPQKSAPFFLAALCVNYLTWGGAAALIAQMPVLGERLKISPDTQGILLAAMVFSQFGSFFLLKRWRGWIFNWVFIAAPGLFAALAFVLLAFGTWQPLAFLALGLFGLAIGFTYCGSIYYALCPDGSNIRTAIHEATLGVGSLTLPTILGLSLNYYQGEVMTPTLVMAAVFVVVTLGAVGLLLRSQKKAGR
ncbi:MAG: MFS transporter [Planctomycetota bacterium]|nr:MFS transporter [Planctomycetota bacterium]